MNAEEISQLQQKPPFLVCPSKNFRPEEVFDLYRTGRRAGQVARLIGVGINDATDLIVEGQQIQHLKAIRKAVQSARLSVLVNPLRRVN